MGERLHGRWQLTATKSAGGVRESVVIAGTDASDGRHEVRSGTPLRLDVNGAQWDVSLQMFLSNGWQNIESLKRDTKVVPGQGLTIQLSTAFAPDPLSTLKASFVSRDPVINPPPIPNPFDFSLSGG